MAEAPPKMRNGRPGGQADEAPSRSLPIEDDERDTGHDFALESDEDRHFNQIEEWIILADRRLERLDARIERLGIAIDQLNTQLGAVLTEMPTRQGVNLYLVGGLVGGLAVGLAIMGITIGGFVGGLSSLKPGANQAAAPMTPYPSQPQAPIIIQMPAGTMSSPAPQQALPIAPPSSPPTK